MIEIHRFPKNYDGVEKRVNTTFRQLNQFMTHRSLWTFRGYVETVWQLRYLGSLIALGQMYFADAKEHHDDYVALEQRVQQELSRILLNTDYLAYVLAEAQAVGTSEAQAAAIRYQRLATEAGAGLEPSLQETVTALRAKAIATAAEASQTAITLRQYETTIFTLAETEQLVAQAPQLQPMVDPDTGLLTVTAGNLLDALELVSDPLLRALMLRNNAQGRQAMAGLAASHVNDRLQLANTLNAGHNQYFSWAQWQEYLAELQPGEVEETIYTALRELAPIADQEWAVWCVEQKTKGLSYADFYYYRRQMQAMFAAAEEGAVTFEQVRQTLKVILIEWFKLTSVDISPWRGYAKDLWLITATKSDGEMGYIVLDLFARLDKSSAARTLFIQPQGQRIAVVCMNLDPNTLWSQYNLGLLGHEIGHGLQVLLNRSSYPSLSIDFPRFTVEVCSTLMERLMQHPRVLELLSMTANTKRSLVGEALYWNRIATLSQFFWDMFATRDNTSPSQLIAGYKEVFASYDLFNNPLVEIPIDRFAGPHMYDDYEALYAAYIAAPIIVAALQSAVLSDLSILPLIYEAGSLHPNGYRRLLEEILGQPLDMGAFVRNLKDLYEGI